MAQRDRISIGPDEEIELLEFDYDSDSILELDEFKGSYYFETVLRSAEDKLGQFWNKLETDCLVGCCGVQAFGFWPDDIARVVQELDGKGLLRQLEDLRNRVLASSAGIVSYHRFNQNFARKTFLQLLNHLITEVEKRA